MRVALDGNVLPHQFPNALTFKRIPHRRQDPLPSACNPLPRLYWWRLQVQLRQRLQFLRRFRPQTSFRRRNLDHVRAQILQPK